jgi:hypothetical protein
LLKNIQSNPPINPPLEVAYTKENPMTNQSTVRIARPEKVCIRIEREFLLLINPASKKPRAGIINITSAVEISTQEVSPAFMANTQQIALFIILGLK